MDPQSQPPPTPKKERPPPDAMKSFKGFLWSIMPFVAVYIAHRLATAIRSPNAFVEQVLQVSNGYGAKLSCSQVFLANRTQASMDSVELLFPPIIFGSSFTVDYESKCVVGSYRFNPKIFQTACYRNRQLGCVLMNGRTASPLSKYSNLWAPTIEGSSCSAEEDPSLPWPWGGASPPSSSLASALDGVDLSAIDALASAHFAHTSLHARAFLLVRDGVLIYERYGDGATAATPQIGWSMTKSLTSTLLGARALQAGGFDLSTDVAPALWPGQKVEESSNTNHFSLGNMLQMSDGLDFDEDYAPGTVTTEMLFTAPATSDVMPQPARRPASSGKKCFHYSSLTTNLLQKFLKSTFPDVRSYLSFPETALFSRINIRSATLETDPSNTFVGSSFSYMTPRDWAKLGLLWLNDGVWPSSPLSAAGASSLAARNTYAGERILPEGWMSFAAAATPSSNGAYGAHFWRGGNERSEEEDTHSMECDKLFHTRVKPAKAWWRDSFPEGSGTFAAHGFEEQMVAMIPSKGVVMVRLGASKEVVLMWEKEKVKFYRGIMDSIRDKK